MKSSKPSRAGFGTVAWFFFPADFGTALESLLAKARRLNDVKIRNAVIHSDIDIEARRMESPFLPFRSKTNYVAASRELQEGQNCIRAPNVA
jgi:hypothetical protein